MAENGEICVFDAHLNCLDHYWKFDFFFEKSPFFIIFGHQDEKFEKNTFFSLSISLFGSILSSNKSLNLISIGQSEAKIRAAF